MCSRGFMSHQARRGARPPDSWSRALCAVHTVILRGSVLSSCGCEGVSGERVPGLLEQESVDFEWSLFVKGVPEIHGV